MIIDYILLRGVDTEYDYDSVIVCKLNFTIKTEPQYLTFLVNSISKYYLPLLNTKNIPSKKWSKRFLRWSFNYMPAYFSNTIKGELENIYGRNKINIMLVYKI